MTVDVDGQAWSFTHVAPADLTGQELLDYVDRREGFYQDEIRKNLAVAPDGSTLPEHPDPVPGSPKALLAGTDHQMCRVVEDIWEALKAKGMVTDEDLTQSARDRMAVRAAIRAEIG
ncbi:MAG: hypothetical protein V1742_11145 [Pseudomonadota bacterium]